MNVKCNTCEVELDESNWSESWKKTNRTQCKNCSYAYNKNSNPNRMFVNGKYIPQSHPLYKAGSYTTFNDAAFSTFDKLSKVLDGYVYAITNPAWEGWVKIGMAVDAEDRCNAYQTSSPFRDYTIEASISVKDRRKSEAEAHKKAKKIARQTIGEWFNLPIEEAKHIIEELQ
jgi:DNA-directed RNA polymerase subunit RPC12/RpoP